VSVTAVGGHEHRDFTTLKELTNPVTFRGKIHTALRYRRPFIAAMTSSAA
jgi:hypothetical protein